MMRLRSWLLAIVALAAVAGPARAASSSGDCMTPRERERAHARSVRDWYRAGLRAARDAMQTGDLDRAVAIVRMMANTGELRAELAGSKAVSLNVDTFRALRREVVLAWLQPSIDRSRQLRGAGDFGRAYGTLLETVAHAKELGLTEVEDLVELRRTLDTAAVAWWEDRVLHAVADAIRRPTDSSFSALVSLRTTAEEWQQTEPGRRVRDASRRRLRDAIEGNALALWTAATRDATDLPWGESLLATARGGTELAEQVDNLRRRLAAEQLAAANKLASDSAAAWLHYRLARRFGAPRSEANEQVGEQIRLRWTVHSEIRDETEGCDDLISSLGGGREDAGIRVDVTFAGSCGGRGAKLRATVRWDDQVISRTLPVNAETEKERAATRSRLRAFLNTIEQAVRDMEATEVQLVAGLGGALSAEDTFVWSVLGKGEVDKRAAAEVARRLGLSERDVVLAATDPAAKPEPLTIDGASPPEGDEVPPLPSEELAASLTLPADPPGVECVKEDWDQLLGFGVQGMQASASGTHSYGGFVTGELLAPFAFSEHREPTWGLAVTASAAAGAVSSSFAFRLEPGLGLSRRLGAGWVSALGVVGFQAGAQAPRQRTATTRPSESDDDEDDFYGVQGRLNLKLGRAAGLDGAYTYYGHVGGIREHRVMVRLLWPARRGAWAVAGTFSFAAEQTFTFVGIERWL